MHIIIIFPCGDRFFLFISLYIFFCCCAHTKYGNERDTAKESCSFQEAVAYHNIAKQ